MKTKFIGLGILAAVIAAAVIYVFVINGQEVTEIKGYVGGEKIGLLEDEEVQDILGLCQGGLYRYGNRGQRGNGLPVPVQPDCA